MLSYSLMFLGLFVVGWIIGPSFANFTWWALQKNSMKIKILHHVGYIALQMLTLCFLCVNGLRRLLGADDNTPWKCVVAARAGFSARGSLPPLFA